MNTLLRLALLLTLLMIWSPTARAKDIAVVAHPDVPMSDLSFSDLQKVLRGDRQFWEPGQPITLIVRAPVSDERTLLLERIYKMSEAQFKRYWISKVFRGEAAAEPRVVPSSSDTADLLAALAGSVALMRTDEVPDGLKVLTVDGLQAGDAGYALARNSD